LGVGTIDIIIYLEDEDNNRYELYIKGNARNPDVSDVFEKNLNDE